MKRKFFLPTMLSLGLAALSAQANAGEDDVNRIIKSLAPIAGQSYSGHVPDSKLYRYELRGRTIVVDTQHAVNLEVYFPFDSDALTPLAKGQLRALGAALRSADLRPYTYLVVGHTDAKGSADYNRDLSRRRAESVRAYLIERFAIASASLEAIGVGEDQLKLPDEPYAAANRRVEVMMVVPGNDGLLAPEDNSEPHATIVPPPGSSVTIKIN